MTYTLAADGWDVPVPIHVRAPGGPAAQVVLMFHHRTGLDAFTEDAAARLTATGALVVIPELFAGMPAGLEPDEYKSRLHDDPVIDLTRMLVADTGTRFGLGRPAAIGFCLGGRLALLAAAADTGVRRASCFYGGATQVGWHSPLSPIDRLAGGGGVPVQLHRGNRDSAVTAESELAAVQAADATGTPLEACVYAGARHAFCNASDPLRYHSYATERAWANALSFLAMEEVLA
ncbi:MAG: dienelactone hydrolase family protein [Nocardia sp.]|uniref:dienelactone hydrolase family protein n=1 Tax=Nocardia sp. TaxID=1821 RepID=UPI0026090DB7|nr:dienelactone hydrolase family protein [Nocardia sp.]MCU1640723.1 dienelactone hydrolase family protein [Nocardia sp.]